MFGHVENREIILNEFWERVRFTWIDLMKHNTNIELDKFIVMPNHVHGIIEIVGAPLVGAHPNHRAGTRPAPTLGDIVGAFKSITTNEYIRNVKTNGWAPFRTRLWQRNYYDRVIRTETELNKTREYIEYNPKNWADDEYNILGFEQ